MVLEFLYLDGCAAWQQALENLRQALRAEGLALKVSLVRVVGVQHAKALKFRGCPSIRLDEEDIINDRSREFGLFCRLYQTVEGLKGWPTPQMIRQGLRALGAFETSSAVVSV